MSRALAVVAAAVAVVLAPGAVASADELPYRDPAAVGKLTLCDTRGHVTTHGDVRIKPFIWRAVGSAPAPEPYNGAGRTATLFGYQPIKGVDPVYWNGEYLTGSGRYTNPNRPMAPSTAADPSLADFLTDYPPKWDGLIQLRMFLGVPGEPTLTTPYNAATLRISGDTWTLVDGGTTGCSSGKSVSSELALPAVRKLGTPAPNATTDVPVKPGTSHSAGTARSAGPGRDTAAAAPETVSGSPVADADSSGSSSSSALPWVLVTVAVVLFAGGAVWSRVRARGRHP
jgi:hypothetical protein